MLKLATNMMQSYKYKRNLIDADLLDY